MAKKPTSITDIYQKAKETEIANTAANSAIAQLQIALQKLADLEAENRHLKELLMRSNEKLIINPVETKDEELVADYEIKRLKEAAQTRPLSLEEAKIYQIMTSAKKTIREVEEKEAGRIKDVTHSVPIQDLLRVAKGEIVDESDGNE